MTRSSRKKSITGTEGRTPLLPSGRRIPILGQRTWGRGKSRRDRNSEIAAIGLRLDLGMTLIDTAEMYGEGGAEKVIAEAIASRRAEVFLVSKVYPHKGECSRKLRYFVI